MLLFQLGKTLHDLSIYQINILRIVLQRYHCPVTRVVLLHYRGSFSAWRNICASYLALTLANAKNTTSCYNGINYSLTITRLPTRQSSISAWNAHCLCRTGSSRVLQTPPDIKMSEQLPWATPKAHLAQFPGPVWGKGDREHPGATACRERTHSRADSRDESPLAGAAEPRLEVEVAELGHLHAAGWGPHASMLPLSGNSPERRSSSQKTPQSLGCWPSRYRRHGREQHSAHLPPEDKQNSPSTENVEVIRTSTSSRNPKTFHQFLLPLLSSPFTLLGCNHINQCCSHSIFVK